MTSFIKHETKICPRCKVKFECKIGDVDNCHCNSISINTKTHIFLESTHFDCLCSGCLEDFNLLQSRSVQLTFPDQKVGLIESLHYYIENGNWVFTELYHFLRGKCCNSACRHCVSGFQNQKSTINE